MADPSGPVNGASLPLGFHNESAGTHSHTQTASCICSQSRRSHKRDLENIILKHRLKELACKLIQEPDYKKKSQSSAFHFWQDTYMIRQSQQFRSSDSVFVCVRLEINRSFNSVIRAALFRIQATKKYNKPSLSAPAIISDNISCNLPRLYRQQGHITRPVTIKYFDGQFIALKISR